MAENLRNTLQGLEADSIITIDRANDGEINGIVLHETERLHGRENFDFYCFLIWPFIEASWLSAVSLLMLTPPLPPPALPAPRPAVYTAAPVGTDNAASSTSAAPFPNKQEAAALPLTSVINHAQLLGKTLYAQGDLSYLEAVNKETLRNSYNQFATYPNALISILPASKDGKVSASVRLNEAWLLQRDDGGALVAKGLLWDFCERISRARREGKNRRDGGTVVRRVLGHVELVGAKLWASEPETKSAKGKKGKSGKTDLVSGQDIQAQARARQGVLSKL